jgi:exodeoxyribonuclease-1
LPEGVTRLPIKTIHLNKSPVVIANLRTLSAERAAAWNIDVDLAQRHADILREKGGTLAGLWPEVFQRPAPERASDVDEDLYSGFLGNDDRRTLNRLRALKPDELAAARPAFADARLDELLFRYRARNFPATLNDADQQRWHEHRVHRLHEGAGGGPTLEAFFAQVDTLFEAADERGEAILGSLVDYATEIAPERD